MVPKCQGTFLWIPLEIDHFITQFISGHGDFNEKLNSFKLKDSLLCQCGESESVQHILFACPRVDVFREELKTNIARDGLDWPCELKELVRTRRRFEAIKKFAKESLTNRTDNRTSQHMGTNGAEVRHPG